MTLNRNEKKSRIYNTELDGREKGLQDFNDRTKKRI